MSARTKALRAHRKRLKSGGFKRVEVSVRAEDVGLVRDVAAKLRTSRASATRIKAALQDSGPLKQQTSVAEALYDPVIAGPEFDQVFEEIERSRRDPAMMKMRDVDL